MHAYISGDSGGNAAVAAEASTTRLELPGTELSSRATDGGADGAVGVATVVLADRPRPARWVLVARGARKQMAGVLRKPPVIALLVGLTIGLVRPLQAALFDDDGALHVVRPVTAARALCMCTSSCVTVPATCRQVGLALVSLSDASVPMVNLMLAFSLGHKLRSLARCPCPDTATHAPRSRRAPLRAPPSPSRGPPWAGGVTSSAPRRRGSRRA